MGCCYFYQSSDADDDQVVENSVILTNYPNPFNPETTITFLTTTEITEDTELVIYNMKGQRVKDLTSSLHPSLTSSFSIIWDGRDNFSNPVPSGIYLCRLTADGVELGARRLVLVK